MIRFSHTLLSALILGTALSGCESSISEKPVSISPQASGFDSVQSQAEQRVKTQISQDVIVPTPKDAGGGYTHEKHKDNAKLIYDAGQLYTLTGDAIYAEYAGKVMLAYADVYPSWDLHPAQKEQSPGRMFWQNLNESWWLLHVAQSYNAIKATLSEEQREKIETDLLRNMADFLSDGSPKTFNKIHNHGTWATAAVGLTGYAINDEDYVEQALLGLDKSGDAGFLKQMNKLFSPDGYYNEGPYYQRYALMPFVIFAQAVEKNNPERKIFEQRDGILKKAIYTTIQQNYGGLFFPINDAIKDKGIATTELLHGVAIAYELTGDAGLLSIAQAQGEFVLTPESRKLAEDIAAGKTKSFNYKTMRLGDGEDGTEGALDILRVSTDPKDLVLVAKNTSQGLGHGHFDKLGFLLYDEGLEIIRDYGAARFLNVEAKYGGHYLAENNKFAKQTIAHNALVVDETSHFNGKVDVGNENAPELGVFFDGGDLKITSAEIKTAYPDVTMDRTMAMVSDAAFPSPIIIDLIEGHSENSHQYDLPFYYNGQLTETNFKITADTTVRRPLGLKNGYEYLWRVGHGSAVDGLSKVTWLLDRKFYSVTSSVPNEAELIFAEIGANDPNFNLRREPAFIIRAKSDDGISIASVIEPHGEYNPIVEYTVNSHSNVKTVQHFENGGDEFIRIETKDGEVVGLAISGETDAEAVHSIEVAGTTQTWTGPYKLFHSQKHLSGDN
ncbi:alginate lyase [Litorimonas taeanensis]|uniref:Alginate lyase n=1 Tax=Litorimonas taeanensis TaxID=568099 RepID=A0A420WLM4_9PROT|nr:heparinase II/III family protein [Litorimonas taeanensis]RKQ71890.1 alginate lyase [Litorimonas taeanensis]